MVYKNNRNLPCIYADFNMIYSKNVCAFPINGEVHVLTARLLITERQIKLLSYQNIIILFVQQQTTLFDLNY